MNHYKNPTVPTSGKPPFWQRQHTPDGNCDENAVMQMWRVDIGLQQDYWSVYAEYSQEQLRQEITTNWQSWTIARPIALHAPWVWAVKVYLWRFPLDTVFAEDLRNVMGLFWIMHVRHSDDDWAWLYAMRTNIPMHAVAHALSLLPAHRIGSALAMEIPPVFEGYSPKNDTFYTTHTGFLLSQPALALLNNYSDVLLHEAAPFYPRWRALLICLYNSLQKEKRKKNAKANLFVHKVFDDSLKLLNLTTRTIWKGFNPAWITMARRRSCTSLELWDAAVVDFSRPTNWREQLQKSATDRLATTVFD